jgi:hypothetical protein
MIVYILIIVFNSANGKTSQMIEFKTKEECIKGAELVQKTFYDVSKNGMLCLGVRK